MLDLTIAMLALIGGLSLVYAAMAFLADFALPYLSSKPWRPNRRPAATYRRRS
jgi:hypothetical protein